MKLQVDLVTKETSTGFSAKANYIFAVLFVLVWLIYSLPTILFSQWFPMDLGQIFAMGQDFQDWYEWILSPYNGSGRYFPVYWGYYTLQAHLFGTHVAPFFLIQCLIFGATAILLSWMFNKLTRDKFLSSILLVTFFFSTAIPENLNSIGKAEPLASFFIVCILAIFLKKADQSRQELSIKTDALSVLAIGLIFSLSIWTKETSMVLLGFGVFCSLAATLIWRIDRSRINSDRCKRYLVLLLALFMGVLISRIPYAAFEKKIDAANYTDYTINLGLVLKNLDFYITQQPDILYFGVLSIVFLLFIGRKILTDKQNFDDKHISAYVFAAGMAAMGWAYYLALLIWRWPMAYYMLLSSVLFKFSFLYGIYVLKQKISANRFAKYALASTVTLVLTYTLAQAYYITESHIAYSRVYTDAMLKSEHYLHQPGPQHSLVIESYPFYAEQSGLQYDIGNGWTRVSGVKGIADVLDPEVSNNKELMKLLLVTEDKLAQNFNNLPRYGDYLLVFTGSKLATWFTRGVTPYFLEDSILKQQGAYDMELVAEKRIDASAPFLHTWTNKLVWENTYVGYKLYRVLNDTPKFMWKGRYPDGWIGNKSSLQIGKNYNAPIALRLSSPAFSLPNKVKIFKDGQLFQEIEFTNPDEKVVKIADHSDGKTLLEFEVEKTAVPKRIGLGKDTRPLGLLVDLDRSLTKP